LLFGKEALTYSAFQNKLKVSKFHGNIMRDSEGYWEIVPNIIHGSSLAI